MALKCKICGVENPSTNRYCGQCGKSLWQVNHPEASADLPPEAIEFDNQVPLIAEEGTDRRLHPSPEMVEQVHDHLEKEAEMHDALHHESESHFDVRAREDAARDHLPESRTEFLRWDLREGKAADDDADKTRIIDLGVNPVAAPPPDHQNPPEEQRSSQTGVSGPSFLGLSDDCAPVYEDRELEPESHVRRNVALAILAVVVILVGIQWRSFRDYGVAYMQNGSMEAKPAKKGAPLNPPAVAADNTSRDLGPPPATTKTGAPQPVESSPNANHALPVQPVQQAGTSSNPDRTASSSPRTDSATQPPSMGAPTPDLPANVPEKVSSTAVSRPGKPRPYSLPARNPSSNAPGTDEMNRARRASDAAARAVWLWKAVGKGNPQAPLELAAMYERGNGVVRSCDQAAVLLRSAAAKGNAQAKLNLQQLRIHGGCSGR